MLEQRNLKLDLLALGLLALTVFLAASLLTYDPADPPSNLVHPRRSEIANVCGPSGVVVSSVLFWALGLGAYYVLLSLAVLDALLLLRRPVDQPVLRAFGWLLSLAGICTLVAMAAPGLSPGPVIGPGGLVGAAGRGLLEMHFAAVGGYILVSSIILGGLLLSTDYFVIRLFTWLVVVPATELARGLVRVAMAYAAKLWGGAAEQEDWTEGEEADEADREPEVRIAGPGAADVDPAAAEEEEEGDDQDDEGAGGSKRSLLPLRIRKPRKTTRQELFEEIEAAAVEGDAADYDLPNMDLLLEAEPFCFERHEKDVRQKARVLEKTLADFGIHVRVVEIQTGPVIAQFEVALEAGLRLSRITSLADDLAIALKVPSVRIVAPIPGKNTVGIEVPNSQRQLVRLREVMEDAGPQVQAMRIPLFLGKDVAGNPLVVDLASMPHLLIAGRTGTGKSVALNSMIVSILMTRRPDEVRMLLVDPKMVELSPYKKIPHLMHPVVTDMRKAEAILAWAVEKMEERYQLLARAGVRHLTVYNQLGEEELRERMDPIDDQQWSQIPKRMPFIVIVADEMADLMMTAAKEVEAHIIRLAQKSRAVGIHLVLATQKPTVDVITGLIKSNLPARICFEVASRTDSRVVLDEMGGEKLLGNGDMLFLRPGTSSLIRGQGTYLSDDEILRVISAVATSEPQFVKELVQLKLDGPEQMQLRNRDELYEAAVDVLVREGRGSVSLLQRALGIGYGRAARLIDYMAEDGIVGPYNGSQAREVLISVEQWDEMRGQPAGPTQPARRSTIHVPNAIAATGPPNNAQIEPLCPSPAPQTGSLDTAPWEEEDRVAEQEYETCDEQYEDEDEDEYEEDAWEEEEEEDEDWEEDEEDYDEDEEGEYDEQEAGDQPAHTTRRP